MKIIGDEFPFLVVEHGGEHDAWPHNVRVCDNRAPADRHHYLDTPEPRADPANGA